jgi:hypothetical protein
MTSLMLACERKNAAAAAELMEATKNAGALDLQVNVVWSVWCEGCGQVVGAGREEGGGGAFAQGTNICVYAPLQDCLQRSALHYASRSGLESAVAQLLSLGADAALKDAVRACSYMNTFMYRGCVHICKCIPHTHLSLYNVYHADISRLYAIHVCVSVCV